MRVRVSLPVTFRWLASAVLLLGLAPRAGAQQLSDIRMGFMGGSLTSDSGTSLSLFGGDAVSGVFSNGEVSFSVGSLTTSHYIATGNEPESRPDLPTVHALRANYPNPFNPSTTIRYELAGAARVSVRIFDLLGREVASLVNTQKPAGVHTAVFDASKLASGVYIYGLYVDGRRVSVRQMTLVR